MSISERDRLLSALGAELHSAYSEHKAIEPLTTRGYNLSLDEAYRIQRHMLTPRISAGVNVVGKKIGATSEPVQKAVGIDQPDFGCLLADCAFQSGDIIPFDRLIQPKAEGEIAFFLAEDLRGPGITSAVVIEATQYVSPCLEIVDSRIRDWQINIVDTIADNASCGVFIMGKSKVDPSRLNLASRKMVMEINQKIVATGTGAASLGHPANAVAWLANRLGELGETLTAGQPILSGSLGVLVDVNAGDEVRLVIEDIGECTAQFS